MTPRKIIVDTDPGVDDILALLLAFSALPEELEVLLVSITYGNIDVQNALRNAVSVFYHVEKEIAWRKSQGRTVGFDALRRTKPVVAVGPDHPLTDQMLMADFFHGRDGLGGIHQSHPHLTPQDTWKSLFDAVEKSADPVDTAIADDLKNATAIFTPSRNPGAKEILRVLRENEPDTVTVVAIGPLTNVALAAAEDPETFLRVKEVVIMGGSVKESGNMTPVAEFNIFADAIAAARVFALTSPNPDTTMPSAPPAPPGLIEGTNPPPFLAAYPTPLSHRLKLTMFPLDITGKHLLARGEFRAFMSPLLDEKSPLAEWVDAFMAATFAKVESLSADLQGDAVALQLHDPLCIWYCMAGQTPGPEWELVRGEDVRVETAGQWTRGMCVVDRRSRRRLEDADGHNVPGDHGNWLHGGVGNRLDRCVGTPGTEIFGGFILRRVFAS